MVAESTTHYGTEARQHWIQARRKARLETMTRREPGEPTRLHDFNDIARRLNLRHAIYRGVENVPLAAIAGSLGRYNDFTMAFLPGDDGLKTRWERIAAIYLDPTSGGVPPVELYKVGASYFVKDGNHRVSVAQQLELDSIEAYVWEYPHPVPDAAPDADITALLIEAERREFLERTGLDDLRPGHGIVLTAPGGYPALLAQIADYQRAFALIDAQDTAWADAVTGWYDLLYETAIQDVQDTGLLDLFPERTAADFYVWVRQHQQALAARYGRRVRLMDAARNFEKLSHPGLATRAFRTLVRWLAASL
jgi:hypothetical protein